MEMGSWAIMNNISPLWGLVPLFVFIGLSFRKNINPLIPVTAGVIVGWIMTGNTPTTFGQQLLGSLGSMMGMVGLLVLLASGLGEVLTRTHISTTICVTIANRLKVNNTRRALFALMVSMFAVTVCLGSFGSAAAIVTPIMIPLMATFEVAPVAAAVAVIFSAMSAYCVAPIYVGTFTILEVTGLSYGEYLTGSALLLGTGVFVVGYFTVLWVQKKASKESEEHYEEVEGGDLLHMELSKSVVNRTLLFLVLFIACIIYTMVAGVGMAFIIFAIPALAILMGVLSRLTMDETLTVFFDGCVKMFQVFILCLFYQMLINVINVTGAFEAVGELLLRTMGSSLNETSAIIIGTIVGAFGVDGATSAQILIINELFGTVVETIKMNPKLWSMVLLAGSTFTVFMYPNVGIIAPMGMCKTKDFKNVMLCMWICTAVLLVIIIAYAFIAPHIL